MNRAKQSQSFFLPRLDPAADAKSVGFYGDSTERLGYFHPGERPLIYDPTWTGTKLADAILVHEYAHQDLTINTHHGCLTQILTLLSRQGDGEEALRACIEEQWSVQELVALHAEFSFIQRILPEAYEAEIRRLPTAILNQPPYRELFFAGQQILPMEKEASLEERKARSAVMTALAGCSLQTRCLVELANTGFHDKELANYLRRESPNRRFEKIVRSLGIERINALAHDMAGRYRSERQRDPARARRLDQEVVASCVGEICRLVQEPAIERRGDLEQQGSAAINAVNASVGRFRASVARTAYGRTHGYVDSPTKRRRLEHQFPRLPIQRRELATWLERCRMAGGDLHLILGSPQFAATCLAPSSSTMPPDDLRGILPPLELLDALQPYSHFPRAVSFIADDWRLWYHLFSTLPRDSWVHRRMMDAVRICVHRTLTSDHVRRLLEFEELGKDPCALVIQLKQDLFVGCFASPDCPGTYALQKIPSIGGLRLFNQILDDLEIPYASDPIENIPHFELIKRIVAREFVDPPEFH
ncbi:MAG TPA: hypothetical protein VEC06_15835 [Paucimonas sp.]|nr:hypothetical protein [Paucimonas sp.]